MRKCHGLFSAVIWGVIAATAPVGCGGGDVKHDPGTGTIGGTGGSVDEDASPGATGGSSGTGGTIGSPYDAAAPDRPTPDAMVVVSRVDAESDSPVRPDGSGAPAEAGAPDGGGADTTADGGDPEEQNQKACVEYWTVACGRYLECAPLVLHRDYGADVNACITYGTALCKSRDNPTAPNMPAMITACAEEMRKGSCTDFVAANFPSCRLAGPRANGGKCSRGRECQSGRCIGGGEGEKCGTCGGVASAGGTCDTVRDCAAGLTCDSTKHCATALPAAKSCKGSADCQQGLFCNAAGICAAISSRAGDSCEPGGCDLLKELSCHPTKKICVAVEFGKAGQECGTFDTKEVVCPVLGKCPAASGTARAACPKVFQQGDACKDDGVCVPETTCASGICRKLEPLSCQ
jgi:hypothetical protein